MSSSQGVCSIHHVMLQAEKAMREELDRTTLADLAQRTNRKAPASFQSDVREWLAHRLELRAGPRTPRG